MHYDMEIACWVLHCHSGPVLLHSVSKNELALVYHVTKPGGNSVHIFSVNLRFLIGSKIVMMHKTNQKSLIHRTNAWKSVIFFGTKILNFNNSATSKMQKNTSSDILPIDFQFRFLKLGMKKLGRSLVE